MDLVLSFHMTPNRLNYCNSVKLSKSSIHTLFSQPTHKEKVDIDLKVSEEVGKSVEKFITETKKSLQDVSENKDNDPGTAVFESLMLYGQHNRKIKNLFDKPEIRGSIRLVEGRLIILDSKKKRRKSKKNLNSPPTNFEELYLQMTIKYHGATDVAQNWKVDDVPSNLQLLLMHKLKTLSSSDSVTDSTSQISSLLPQSEWDQQMTTSPNTIESDEGSADSKSQSSLPIFTSAKLVTSQGTWELTLPFSSVISPKKGKNNSKKKNKVACVFRPTDISSTTIESVVPLSHDVPKKVPLEPSALFFQKLGVSDAKGKARPGMASKLKQCQRFVEIVGKLVDKHIIEDNELETRTLSSVDMGCGRGYLTFALHAYLTQQQQGRCTVKSRGIEMRPKLVSECNGIVQDLVQSTQSEFGGDLKFVEGTIEQSLASIHQQGEERSASNNLDILIALHACDTATDDALWYGIQRNARLIVTAPCCHREVRSQIEQLSLNNKNDRHSLADILRHGIYRERVGEIVTDSLRALLLELANYQVQVFEFIGGEHTSKNVMITAVKAKKSLSAKSKEQIRTRIRALSDLNGIKSQRLATWMNENLSLDGGTQNEGNETIDRSHNPTKSKLKNLRNRQMPAPPLGLDV